MLLLLRLLALRLLALRLLALRLLALCLLPGLLSLLPILVSTCVYVVSFFCKCKRKHPLPHTKPHKVYVGGEGFCVFACVRACVRACVYLVGLLLSGGGIVIRLPTLSRGLSAL